jgi:dipeptidyl-peptidase-4
VPPDLSDMKHLRDRGVSVLLLALAPALFIQGVLAQDRLKTMPGYQRHEKIAPQIAGSVVLGTLKVNWTNDGNAFEYQREGRHYRYEVLSRTRTELHVPTNAASTGTRRPSAPENRAKRQSSDRPARGRQFDSAASPDGKFKAIYHDRNVWLAETNGTNEVAVTVEGSPTNRVKYGTASWAYGEELRQRTAMWWSTNSQKLAFYRFDESHVPDFYLALDLTTTQDKLGVEPYPKAGGTNPVVDLLIYDVKAKTTVRVDVRDGQPWDNNVVGHYVYGVAWSPDGTQLLFHRTNRRQNILEFCAADPASGKCRVIVHETWPASWVENLPSMRFLQDGRRFLWTSQRSGWKNFYLYDLVEGLLRPLTEYGFDVGEVVDVDERFGVVYYLAHSGDNPLKPQLHRVGLDGKGERRLTDPAFHHSIAFSPNHRFFLDTEQTHDCPPFTTLRDYEGNALEKLASSDSTKFHKLGLRPVELLCFKAADGQTDLYGMLHFPSNFRPDKKYPVLVSVYAGPETSGARESFTLPSASTEYGFLVASFDSRSAPGRGKRLLDSIYRHLGQTEIDDQATGLKSLWTRRYVNRRRVGVYGTSYGGTAAAMCLLRYPEVFQAACSSSPVTDFRNYDTIYAERYLWIPQECKATYDAASLLTYAGQLRGRLMLYYGSADDNVHPSNMMQFVQALQKAGKGFELQAGPDQGHGGLNQERMMEFFIENLVLK